MKLPAQRKDVELLFKTIRDLVPQTDLETLLQYVIKVSTQILGADRTMLFLFDRKSEALVFKYGVNIEEGLIEEAHQFSASVIERAKKGEFIMAADSQDRKKFSPSYSIYKFDIKTILCAPILTDDRLIGVIYADTKGKKARLDDEKKSYFLTFVELIADLIGRTIDLHDKEGELAYLKKRLVKESLFPEIVGRSPSIESVKEKILRITAVNYPVSVLILGESGTGKELIARATHQAGSRSGKPFVVVNCAAIPANLMESELFGHEKGAFTGALSRKPGLFENADGGIIFLDEIGDLPVELQPKLLRVLQFGTFTRVGGRTELSVDVQVLCATSKDLYREMEDGRFRKALFHRLAVEVIRVPSLRERKQDVLLLANHFMRFFSEKMEKPLTGIDAGAQNLLKAHDYEENNVRELKNVMERAVLTAEGKNIAPKDIVFSDELLLSTETKKVIPETEASEIAGREMIDIKESPIARLLEESAEKGRLEKRKRPYYQVQEEVDKKLILLSLRQSGWKMKPAAKMLGINYLNFKSKLESMIREYIEENQYDLIRVSKTYNIPLKFLKTKMHRVLPEGMSDNN